MAPIKVILLACGSFNPPTNMHLRMFEVAKDNLNRLGQYLVVGGIISPVHDSYGKKDLVPSSYRCEMLKLALQSSDWIKVSNWECSQETWSKTKQVLQYHQNLINSVLNNESTDSQNMNHNANIDGYNSDTWITNDIRNTQGPIQIKLLCGADLLQSFGIPGLWAEADIETIVRHHGLVVVSRQGYDPYRFIYESDILTGYQNNIVIINEWVTNDISSTKIRRALRRQESVKYLIEDSVIDFIKKHGLYGCLKNEMNTICTLKVKARLLIKTYLVFHAAVESSKYFKSNINENLTVPGLNDFILTPSPSDVNMKSVGSSSDNIYLELNNISCKKETQSAPEKVPETSGLSEGTVKQEIEQQPEYLLRIKNTIKSGKVGFNDDFNGTEADIVIAQNLKHASFQTKSDSDEYKSPDCSHLSDESYYSGINVSNAPSNESRRGSKYVAKTSDFKTLIKTDSEGGDKKEKKSILMLRRSKSDAVMSRTNANGETASVKIQFTKDGIKVISDKESIV